ncbi:ketosynthase chain-length factor [Nocardia sp. NPDC056000]|uniref:ketosynthase chain-length factor n=1 Tax=Nocardia sp. NPDC056000 TaxID=3345674 RepID=UPI0035DF3F00
MSTGKRTGAPQFTGMGIVAPTGLDIESYWSSTLAGRNALAPIKAFDATRYPTVLAGEVPDFDPSGLPNRLLPQTDRMTRMALVAAGEALADARLDPAAVPDFEMSVVTASHSGGFEFGQRELEHLWSRGPAHVSAYQSFAWFYAVNTGQISIRHGLRGQNGVVVTEGAGGLDALGQARRVLRRDSRIVLTGATDGSLCPWGWVAQIANRKMSVRHDPARAYLPFDADANGYLPGEGGAILLLETAAAAQARGARSYGELSGYAATFDPPAGSDRPGGLRRAIDLALADAHVGPTAVDVVFADGAGIPNLDATEAAAIRAVFGPYGVPVTVPKSGTGRLYSGAAPLDTAAALLSIRDQVIPPTVNVTDLADGIELDLVTAAPRPARIRTVLVLARGFGGFNSAVVLTAAQSGKGTDG